MRGNTRDYPNRAKNRETRRKVNRLAVEKKRNKIAKLVKHLRADLNVVMMRGDQEVILAPRLGLFGHANAPVYRLGDEEIAGACEDVIELGGICTKLGLMCLAQLVGHNLAYGSDGLAKQFAKWAGIDLEALKKAADADTQGDGGGDSPGEGGLDGQPELGANLAPVDDNPVGPEPESGQGLDASGVQVAATESQDQ